MQVLIADDDPITLRLLESSLRRWNHEVILADNGLQAWEILNRPACPGVALLDWMMPELDGIEICRRRRAQKNSPFVYLILLTSNDRPEDITAGLDAGANDYITKPFDKDELKSRIAVGVRVVDYEKSLEQMNQELRRYSQQMETLAQERAQQLVQADRMISLGTMAAGIAHEINNPLTIIHGNLGLLKGFWREKGQAAYTRFLSDVGGGPSPENVSEMFSVADNAVQRIRKIVDGMRTYSHGRGGRVEIYDPRQCLEDAQQICLPKTKHLGPLQCQMENPTCLMKGNPVQITQVLVNLIANAADALAGVAEPVLSLSLQGLPNGIVYTVQDNGPGIPAEHLEQLWSPFFTTKPIGQGTGLGLSICQNLVHEHGGRIHVKSQPGQGTVFTVELPSEEEYGRILAQRDKPSSPQPNPST